MTSISWSSAAESPDSPRPFVRGSRAARGVDHQGNHCAGPPRRGAGWRRGGARSDTGRLDRPAFRRQAQCGVRGCVTKMRCACSSTTARPRSGSSSLSGAQFDRDPDGSLQLAREGGHSYARVVHAGGAATGAEIERALVESTARSAVSVHEHCFAADSSSNTPLSRGDHLRVPAAGDCARSGPRTRCSPRGAGQLFAVTPTLPKATGDGIAMAIRADVAVADVEFVQFQPAALAVDRMPRPLLSEALRGHGALLRGAAATLRRRARQPRDIVARAILQQAKLDGRDTSGWTRVRSPTSQSLPDADRVLRGAGLTGPRSAASGDGARHYLCGGVLTELDGPPQLPGLGRPARPRVRASTAPPPGVEFVARRLVFGARVIESIDRGKEKADTTEPCARRSGHGRHRRWAVHRRRTSVRTGRRCSAMLTDHVGVLRSRESLERASNSCLVASGAARRPRVGQSDHARESSDCRGVGPSRKSRCPLASGLHRTRRIPTATSDRARLSPDRVATLTPMTRQDGPPATPPGWFPDPLGRHEQRYWDGLQWTEHVSRTAAERRLPPPHSRCRRSTTHADKSSNRCSNAPVSSICLPVGARSFPSRIGREPEGEADRGQQRVRIFTHAATDGAVRQSCHSMAKKVMPVVSSLDQFMTPSLQIVDAHGMVQLTIKRPAKVLQVEVRGHQRCRPRDRCHRAG